MLDIRKIGKKLNISEEDLILYGNDKAKIKLDYYNSIKDRENGKLVLVTAITPTKAGEGKTTTSIALAEGLAKIGQKAMLVLREPSLGPVFGIKGGATGGGKATIEPREDINLHFTGDMHALTSSINLIAAIIDNSLYRGNPLGIDADRIMWSRAVDMNDRALREVAIGLGEGNGIERSDKFIITVASEMMAILCLAKDELDFIDRVNRIIVAYTFDDEPVYLRDLRISHAIFRLMRHALKPNLVQTGEGNPCLVHGGPFANIAHGCNSLIATKLGLKLAPIVITEAGFAADLGAEKFFDIKCRIGELKPDLVVLVATIRALKLHGGKPLDKITEEDLNALIKGTDNLAQHVTNMKKYGLPIVVAINHFATDTPEEIRALTEWCEQKGIDVVFSDGFEKGGEGSIELAKKVVETLENTTADFKVLYNNELSIKEKIETICKQIYRANSVVYSEEAEWKIKDIEYIGYSKLPICMAKTPHSFSDDPNLVGAPKNFKITIRDLSLSAGAGFIVALTGKIMTMPGLPAVPAAVKMEDEGI